ncbi:MAG: transcription-repair coupling factor [Ghiorsea sp.]|nr:transcription-repair coupling factor [Ghiorsea sp.]
MTDQMQAATQVTHLSQIGLAYDLAKRAKKSSRLHVWICPDVRSYRILAEELSFFLQDKPELLWRFPAWEVLPYDRVSPHHGIVGERFATLGRLLHNPKPQGILLTSLPAWLHRIAPPHVVAAHVWQLKIGQHLDISKLTMQLAESGMQASERVLVQGEFAARGGLLDIWPATEDKPLRIDLFGDEIESIRYFDPETQRSGEHLDGFTSVPVREVILDEQGINTFTAAFRARFPQHRTHPMLASVQKGRMYPGIEALLPLAYEHTARLADYLSKTAQIYSVDDLEGKREGFAEQVRGQYEMVRMNGEPSISPQELYGLDTTTQVQHMATEAHIQAAPQLIRWQHSPKPVVAMLDWLQHKLADDWKLMLVAHSMGQQARMLDLCSPLSKHIYEVHGLHDWLNKKVVTSLGFLEAGFVLEDEKKIVLTGQELLGQRLPRRRKSAVTIRADLFSSLQELKADDPVVHEDHGVGRYKGLVAMEDDGIESDFLHIEYAGGTSIYLPVEELDRLHRYTGDDNPSLNKLGSDKWKKMRERVKKDLLVTAHELIDIDAARQQAQRTPIHISDFQEDYDTFCDRFPFEETDEQLQAIDAVLDDLSKPSPMDRVICGDVGFGKTEVAMRAAFAVARSGKQVTVLAPTTVLATQHAAAFSDRFSGLGLKISLLSRLQGKKESDAIIDGLKSGDIRVVVGTHRLLSCQSDFADLGMVIVDEEQRFGVKHKEQLKKIHATVALLTLTATPIPRTLHQTLSGLRSVSIISTPPAEREPIRTMVCQYDVHLVNEAIRRELYRGGQVYYLHNHVKSINRIADRLREDIPEAQVGIAHGKMSATELDKQMMDFYEGRLHVLVCTTIVESGLDVANANTLLVERADMLGLSQLHQIRGRVGRSHRQAYAYLFTPDQRAMTPDARDRLQAIAEHSELGAGFMIARQDMEIRGAGNLLGSEQSGRMDAVGLDLYLDMLSKAVAEAKGKPILAHDAVGVEMHVNAILPPDYVPQIGERLALYRRIARVESDAQVSMLFEELTDRFGKLPDEALFCLENARIRWRAQVLRLKAVDALPSGVRFTFTEHSPIEPMTMMKKVQQEPSRFRLTPDGQLTLLTQAENRARLQETADFLDELLS